MRWSTIRHGQLLQARWTLPSRSPPALRRTLAPRPLLARRPPVNTPAGAAAPVEAGAAPGAGPSVDATAGNQWSEILAMFVDDPRGSVAEASVMVNEAIEAFIATARDRQASVAASWQAPNADTERLRVALQDYRTFWSTVTQLPQPA
jgi:hypothetical protein